MKTRETREAQAHASRFGWLYSDSTFVECRVSWMPDMPDTILDRLKILGFNERPAIQVGRSVGVFVYKRLADTDFVVSVSMPTPQRSPEYALVFSVSGGIEEEPIFANSWPDLLRLLSEVAPALSTLEMNRS